MNLTVKESEKNLTAVLPIRNDVFGDFLGFDFEADERLGIDITLHSSRVVGGEEIKVSRVTWVEFEIPEAALGRLANSTRRTPISRDLQQAAKNYLDANEAN